MGSIPLSCIPSKVQTRDAHVFTYMYKYGGFFHIKLLKVYTVRVIYFFNLFTDKVGILLLLIFLNKL